MEKDSPRKGGALRGLVRRVSPLFKRINPPLLFPLPQGERRKMIAPPKAGCYEFSTWHPRFVRIAPPKAGRYEFSTGIFNLHEFCALRLRFFGEQNFCKIAESVCT
jgi:hypothetical protein